MRQPVQYCSESAPLNAVFLPSGHALHAARPSSSEKFLPLHPSAYYPVLPPFSPAPLCGASQSQSFAERSGEAQE